MVRGIEWVIMDMEQGVGIYRVFQTLGVRDTLIKVHGVNGKNGAGSDTQVKCR